jgi:hypothetical protein
LSLDLNKVSGQVTRMVGHLRDTAGQDQLRLADALQLMHEKAADIASLRERIEDSKTSWLVAGLSEGLDGRYAEPALPGDFTIVATDGSHIEVDRHQAVRCFLLNISRIVLKYGRDADASLENFPELYAGEEGLVIRPPDGQGREQLIEGNILGAKRSVEECRHLADLVESLPNGATSLALLDGTLMLWTLEPNADFVNDILLDRGLLQQFDRIRRASANKQWAFASYISGPRSNDVNSALRIAACPYAKVNCDECSNSKRGCDSLAGLDDNRLFSALLAPGERSDIFISRSKVVREHYGDHEIHFFYLRVDDEELARIEIPRWVAAKKELVELTHSLVLDQCRKGNGYPVALSEAHEQAVVSISDRQNFWQLVEAALIDDKIPAHTTGKSLSKRTKWV